MEWLLQADLAVTGWINTHLHTALLDAVLPFVTTLGDNGFIWILFTVCLLLFNRTRRWGMVCGIALLTGYLTGEVFLKNLVARARPFTHLEGFQLLIPEPAGFSFPSGHSASSFAGATSLFFMNHRNGWWAYPLAGLIAFSRVYLSVHFVTDITAGILLGVASAFFARWLCDRYLARTP